MSGHSGADMTVDDSARDEMGFIAEHLKVRVLLDGILVVLFADVGGIAEYFGGKEAGHETFEILQQQDQLAAERTERSPAAEHVRCDARHALRGVHVT